MNHHQPMHLDIASCRVLDHVDALVRVWTPEEGVVFVNRGWREFTGTTDDDNRGTGWLRCIHDDDRQALTAVLVAGGLQATASEYRLLGPNGQATVVRDAATACTTASGGAGFVHTVSRRLSAATDDDHIKTMSRWAHELRGPLNAILGWSDLLSAGDSPPDIVQRGLKAIASNARQQAQIIKRMTE